jgi:XTP/dITP diphosphohydrolase
LGSLAREEGFELALLPDYDRLPPAREDDASFALNALGKALHYSQSSDLLVAADDSGLAVDALGGRPGVHSARYAGPNATDEDNNRKLVEELRDIPDEERTARFVSVLVLARAGRPLALFSDSVAGRILHEPRGAGGFGYDPLFFIPPRGCTSAELSVQEKNQLSHRGKAFRKLLAYLKKHPLP